MSDAQTLGREMNRYTLRSILAASDLSEGSDAALRTGAALAGAAGAALHVIHAVALPAYAFWEGMVDDATKQEWLREAKTALEGQIGRVLGEAAALGSRTVRIGSPAREITERASEVAADLIVLGLHHPRRVLDDLLGTTADRVIRTAAVPCLIAHRPLSLPLRRVLVPTDFSPPAQRALEVVTDWLAGPLAPPHATSAAATLHLLFVSAFAHPSARPLPAPALLARQEEAARARLGAKSRVALDPRILSAPVPIDGILKMARSVRAGLIVLGTHGYGTLGRALIGSVASDVARMARYPVLLVPPPD